MWVKAEKLVDFSIDRDTKSWIIPGYDEYNCTGSNITSAKGPSASEFLQRWFKGLQNIRRHISRS